MGIKSEELYANVMTTKKVEEIIRKENLGFKKSRSENIWFQNVKQVRRANITFAMTDDELKEYVKCKRSVLYFAEKYCQIKREDGSIGNIKLRDYQVDMVNLFDENRYSILMASRQSGKCVSLKSKINIKLSNEKEIRTMTLGELYYSIVKNERKLKLLEKFKYFLYKKLSKLNE
jgi:hypothetical protein